MTKIAIGTAQFGLAYGVANKLGQIELDGVSEILKLASSNGINILDTAISYGNSESLLGKADVSGWQIVSKLPRIPDNCSDIGCWVETQVLESLNRLLVPKLYGLLLHDPDQLLTPSGRFIYDALMLVKQKGLIDKAGISIYSPKQLDVLLKLFRFDLVQSPINIFDRRLIESGYISLLNGMGVEVHARSIFLQGLLLMNVESRPKKFLKWQEVWTKWDKWLQMNELTQLQACLRYVNTIDHIHRIIIGIDSADQLAEIISVVNGNLPPLPDFIVDDCEQLINPTFWDKL
jgi:aryl-alcohol dehydrogenase-like predicted oxidoreductase